MRPVSGSGPAARGDHASAVARVKRAMLLAAMSATALNVWTGSPLAALWVGSRVQSSSQQPTMAPVAVVAVCMGLFSLALLRLLRWLGGIYDRATGRPPTIRAHVPWLRSLRGERPHEAGPEYSLSALDIVMCASVIIVIVVFEYWFFFLSTSSIDQRSGRG